MISKWEEETVLEVTVRWSHVQIVHYLLDNVQWTKAEILKAYDHVVEHTDNSEIKELLLNYSNTRFGKFYTCFRLG